MDYPKGIKGGSKIICNAHSKGFLIRYRGCFGSVKQFLPLEVERHETQIQQTQFTT